jgi:hypothetical protein
MAEQYTPDSDIIREMKEWASKRADEPILYVGARGYTPNQLVSEVERGTELGRKYAKTLEAIKARDSLRQR